MFCEFYECCFIFYNFSFSPKVGLPEPFLLTQSIPRSTVCPVAHGLCLLKSLRFQHGANMGLNHVPFCVDSVGKHCVPSAPKTGVSGPAARTLLPRAQAPTKLCPPKVSGPATVCHTASILGAWLSQGSLVHPSTKCVSAPPTEPHPLSLGIDESLTRSSSFPWTILSSV